MVGLSVYQEVAVRAFAIAKTTFHLGQERHLKRLDLGYEPAAGEYGFGMMRLHGSEAKRLRQALTKKPRARKDLIVQDEVWALLCEYNESEWARWHALAVEAIMRHMARKAGEDEKEWDMMGLVHDLDYEKVP